MSTGRGKKVQLYFKKNWVKEFGEFNMNEEELYILLGLGRQLFERLQFTPEAKQFLVDHPDLNQVIQKW